MSDCASGLLPLGRRRIHFSSVFLRRLYACFLISDAAICLAAGVGVGMEYAKDRGPSIDIYPDWSLGLAATASGLYFIAAILSGVSIYVAMT